MTDVPGLVYRDGIASPPIRRPTRLPIWTTSFPRRRGICSICSAIVRTTGRRSRPDRRHGYVSIQTSLGCPATTFCCINAPFGGNGIRYWSPDTIVAQIDHIVQTYGIKTIKVPDEMFVLNKNHVLGICDRLIERNTI